MRPVADLVCFKSATVIIACLGRPRSHSHRRRPKQSSVNSGLLDDERAMSTNHSVCVDSVPKLQDTRSRTWCFRDICLNASQSKSVRTTARLPFHSWYETVMKSSVIVLGVAMKIVARTDCHYTMKLLWINCEIGCDFSVHSWFLVPSIIT